jgi:RimJ/RimL family protein N-acetyltransferase
MLVRRATADDAAVMASVIATVAVENMLGTEPPVDLVARETIFRELIARGGREAAWVLELDGEVVGHAAVNERPPGVLVLGMAILAQGRGQGGGRALLRAAIDHTRTSGAHKLDLDVWTDNARAIALYASEGFRLEGYRRSHHRRKDGSLRSVLVMAQRFGDGLDAPSPDGPAGMFDVKARIGELTVAEREISRMRRELHAEIDELRRALVDELRDRDAAD